MSSYENGVRTRIGRIWNDMKKRCMNKNHNSYKYYGAKGITVCDEWINDVDAFKEWALSHGYNDNLSIDRINNKGNYSPDNCRWVDSKQQGNNRGTCRYLEHDGVTMSMQQWADYKGINYKTLARRIYKGLSVKDALDTPVNKKLSYRRKSEV